MFQSPARRRSADELERLLEAVLNVVVTAASTAVAYLSRGIVAPGRTVDFVARLANDMPHPVDLTFGVTDFVCGPRMRINADCVQLSPNPVRIPAGGTTDVAIALRIPLTAPVGIYKAVLKSNEFPALQASLTVAVG